MERLWTPWRLAYVSGSESQACVFCSALTDEDAAPLIVFRGAACYVILNLFPYNNAHLMVVPNRHVESMNDLEEDHHDAIGHLMRMVRVVARGQAIAESGYRVVVNTGADAMMTVLHLHIHILGGRKLGWPPG